MNYNIYAGLGGGFGDAQYCGTGDFPSIEAAEETAYRLAWEEYESYEGMHGLPDWYDIAEQEGYDPESDASAISEAYTEEVESWIDYYVVPTEEDDIEAEELFEL